MAVTKEEYVDLIEKYNKVTKLLNESKSDPETEPYLSQYAAKKILLDMETNLKKILQKENIPDLEKLKLQGMLATTYLNLATTSITTEELSDGEAYLQSCQHTIGENQKSPNLITTSINMLNQFGLLHSSKEPETAKTFLEKAKKLYEEFNTEPIDPFSQQKNAQNFEKIHTFTLYYLAQIYGALKDTLKSSIYCHVTLKRQLESEDFEPIDWALNAATLSQVFMEQNLFKQARHHLSASSHILENYEQKLANFTQNEEILAKIEELKHRSADISRCWAKYGLILLAKSKERLLDDNLSTELNKISLNQDLEFSLDLYKYEREITDKFILTIQDARLVFLNVQSWLRKAETFYRLETLASDFIEIAQDKSQLYQNLLFFEDNLDNQAKLHKRRINILEDVIKKINPQYYLQYCRQIWFELAQIYSDILNIKSDKLRESEERPSAQILTKINHLTERSIFYFTEFINTFKENERIPEDFEKAFLQAYFHVAALNGKFVTLDKRKQLLNTEASFKGYKFVLDYCNVYEEAREEIPMEFGICKEMSVLLPVKISKLAEEIS